MNNNAIDYREKLRNFIGGIDIEGSSGGDNLIIALCSYFERHYERPSNDEESDNGWGEWVEMMANNALDNIASSIESYILEKSRD